MIGLSLRSQILLGIMAPLVLCEISVYLLVDRTTRANARKSIERDLGGAMKGLERELSLRFESLHASAKLLSSDYAFKQAFATADTDTINSALENHVRRVGADSMFLASMEGDLLGASDLELALPAELLHKVITSELDEETDRYDLTTRVKGKIMKLVVVPLRAPKPVAWIFLGFTIGRDLADELKGTFASEVSLLWEDQPGKVSVPVSSLDSEGVRWLESGAARLAPGQISEAEASFGTQIFAVKQETTLEGKSLRYVLQRSLEAEFEPSRKLLFLLAAIFIGVSLVFMVLAFYLARSLTKPIDELVLATKEIAEGRIPRKLGSKEKNELGELARSFDLMSDSLAREMKQRAHAYDSLQVTLAHESLLLDIAKVTSFVVGIEQTLGVIAERVIRAVPANGVYVFLRREGKPGFQLVSKRFASAQASAAPAEAGATETKILGEYLNRLSDSDQVLKPERIARGGGQFFVSHLLISGKHLGSFIFSELPNQPITAENVRLIESVLSLAVLAVENGNVYRGTISDPLTGLFNRKFFEIQAELEMHRAQRNKSPYSLLILKVEGLREHDRGLLADLGLRRIAELAKEKLRRTDVICRLSGEKFAVLLTDTNKEGATITAKNLLSHLSVWRAEEGPRFHGVRFAVGISSGNDRTRNLSAMLDSAEGLVTKTAGDDGVFT